MGSIISAPLGMMASCCGSLAGSCLASMACKACSCSCIAPARLSSILYIATLSAFVVMAVTFRFEGGDIVIGGGFNASQASLESSLMNKFLHGNSVTHMWNDRFWCASKHPSGWVICCADVCGGVYAVYRFSFALCIFFAGLLLCTLATSTFGDRVHRGYWFLKFFTLFSLLVSTLFISNGAMEGYREAARYLSFLFLLMQIFLLIDFGYFWNEKFLEWDKDGWLCDSEACFGWRGAILSCAGVLFCISIALWVVLFVQFGHPECPVQQTIISLTLVFSIILTIISCTKIAPHGTLLTSSVITCYVSYLAYSALASHPDEQCNPYTQKRGNTFSDIFVGLLITAVSMACTAWSATGSKEAIIGKDPTSELTTTLEDGTAKESSSAADDGSASVQRESWWYYHVMMATCSMYMAMLLTDWSWQPWMTKNGVPAVPHEDLSTYNTSLATFWVKVVSQWVCLLMYAWTLLAPYLLREYRDFGVEFDFD